MSEDHPLESIPRDDSARVGEDTWPDTLLRFARHSTELSVRALDSLAA